MAANTTDTELPGLVPKKGKLTDNDKKVVELYEKGLNGYRIADEVYGFTSEEAVGRVKDVIAREFPSSEYVS